MRAVACLLLFALPLLAAPVPAEEKPKPRAKLVGTLTVPVRVQAAHWMPDGKHLVLVTDQRVLVYPREQFGSDKPKPLTAFDRPTGDVEVGTTPDGGVSVLVRAGGKVNAENRLHLWGGKTLLAGGEPKADRVIDLEAEAPFGVEVAADGGAVFAIRMTHRTRVNGNQNWNGEDKVIDHSPTFLRMSSKSGDVRKAVPLADLTDGKYAGSAFDPHTGRLFLGAHVGEETLLCCRDLDRGKTVWEVKLDGKPNDRAVGVVVLSPDGSRLAYTQPTLTIPPQAGFGGVGGRRPPQPVPQSTFALRVLDAVSGQAAGELSFTDAQGAMAHALSSDGRLLFAGIQAAEGGKLGVWDTKSGAELKAWSLPRADVSGAFAPTGKELLIVERGRRETAYPKLSRPDLIENKGGEDVHLTHDSVVRVEHKSVVGLWDLSAVVK